MHQILTLRSIRETNTMCSQEHLTQDSWFPGYAWSIVYCSTCYSHLGWRFDIVDAASGPSHFFGFRRVALTRSWEREVMSDMSMEGID